jgi:hypothetical protein
MQFAWRGARVDAFGCPPSDAAVPYDLSMYAGTDRQKKKGTDRQKKKGPVSRAFRVAGAGFEPATSGL